MSLPFQVATLFAQATNSVVAADQTGSSTVAPAGSAQPWWSMFVYIGLFGGVVYFGLMRPQQLQAKEKAETIKTAKTGDKIVTSSGIHGVITNVKDSTVIVKIADNVKIEVEKTHIEKITRSDSTAGSDKPATAKA